MMAEISTQIQTDSTHGMKDRIREIMKENNLSSARFAEKLGIPKSGISHILSGRNNPSLDYIAKILEAFPYLDSEWLILGKERKFEFNSLKASPAPTTVIQEKMSKLNQRIEQQVNSLSNVHIKNIPPKSKEELNTKETQIIQSILVNEFSGITTKSKNPESLETGLPIERIIIFYSNGIYKEINLKD